MANVDPGGERATATGSVHPRLVNRKKLCSSNVFQTVFPFFTCWSSCHAAALPSGLFPLHTSLETLRHKPKWLTTTTPALQLAMCFTNQLWEKNTFWKRWKWDRPNLYQPICKQVLFTGCFAEGFVWLNIRLYPDQGMTGLYINSDVNNVQPCFYCYLVTTPWAYCSFTSRSI